MDQQISQALAIVQTVVNLAVNKGGIFETVQEASVADAAVKVLIKALQIDEKESKDSPEPTVVKDEDKK